MLLNRISRSELNRMKIDLNRSGPWSRAVALRVNRVNPLVAVSSICCGDSSLVSCALHSVICGIKLGALYLSASRLIISPSSRRSETAGTSQKAILVDSAGRGLVFIVLLE